MRLFIINRQRSSTFDKAVVKKHLKRITATRLDNGRRLATPYARARTQQRSTYCYYCWRDLRTADVGVCDRCDWALSVENREHGLPRLAILRKIQGASRTLEFVPLLEDLGEIDLSDSNLAGPIGAERGPNARPMLAKWTRAIREPCRE